MVEFVFHCLPVCGPQLGRGPSRLSAISVLVPGPELSHVNK